MNPFNKLIKDKSQDQIDATSPTPKSLLSKHDSIKPGIDLVQFFTPSNLQNAQSKLAASANKTKSNLLSFFNNADTQIASFFNEVNDGLNKNTVSNSGKKPTSLTQNYERQK